MRIGILGSGLMRVKLGTIQVQLKGFKKWKSKELDRNLLSRDRQGGSLALCGSIRSFRHPIRHLGRFVDTNPTGELTSGLLDSGAIPSVQLSGQVPTGFCNSR
jgi:hypothetical protein